LDKKVKKNLSAALAATMAAGVATAAVPAKADQLVSDKAQNTTTKSSLDELYAKAYEATMKVVETAKANGVKAYFTEGEKVSTTEAVVKAVQAGMQDQIKAADEAIKQLPADRLDLIGTLSSILDDYQHPVYERIVTEINALNAAAGNVKQADINNVDLLINVAPKVIDNNGNDSKASYSSALDKAQAAFTAKVVAAVEKAEKSESKEDLEAAKALVEELATATGKTVVAKAKELNETVVKVEEIIKEKEAMVKVEKVSAINATTVVATLADETDATKAADKTQYAVKVGDKDVAVSAVNYDAATKKATLTVDLSNLEGAVTVNGVASAKAVDYVAPAIAEVKAQSATVIDVKFSEKVDATEAEKVANYTLRYAVGKASTTSFAAAAADGSVQATAKLLADGQTVRMTIVSVGKDVTFAGLQNGGLIKEAPYQISVADKIVDTAGNKAVSGYGVVFYGTNIADSQAAQVLSAKYDSSTGKLTLSFDKAVDNATASKIKLVATGKDAIALDGLTGTPKGNDVEIDASALATKIAVLGNTFSVQYADGAFVDVNGNNVAPATTAVTVTEGLKVTGASYDANKNVLTLSFNDVVDISKVQDNLAGIKVAGESIGAVKILNTTNAKDIQLQLADETKAGEGTAKLEKAILDNKDKEDGVVVSFNATTTKFYAVGSKDEMKVIGNNVTIKKAAYVADTVAPTLSSVSLKGIEATKGIVTLKFSEKVDPAAVKGADITFYDAKDLTKAIVALDKVDANEKAAGEFVDTLTFDLSKEATSQTTAKAISDALGAKKSLVVSVKAKAVKDLNGTEIAELAPANGVAATVLEATADEKADKFEATAKGAKVVELKITADIKGTDTAVALDKSIAENVANYTVVPTNGGTAIKVNSAVYSTDGTVMLYLDAVATEGKNYTITATGLKTQGGKAVEKDEKSGKFTAAFEGVAAKPTNAIKSLETADVNTNGKFDAGDTITLDFGTPIHLADGAKASDFTVVKGAAAEGAYTLGSSTLKVDGNKLVITLASDAKIATGNTIELEQANTKVLNADDQVAYFAATSVTAPKVDAPMIKTAVYSDANANGKLDKDDTIVVTFTSKVAIADGKTADDLSNDFVLGATGATYTVKLAEDGMGATLTLIDPKTFAPGTTTINVADSNVDLVGNWATKLTKEADADKVVKVAKSDVAQPTVQSAKYVVKEDGTKTIVLQMSEKVSVADTAKTFADNFKVVSADTATIKGTDGVAIDPEDATKLVITLEDADVIVPGISQIKVILANKNGVTDANGNYMLFDNQAITIQK